LPHPQVMLYIYNFLIYISIFKQKTRFNHRVAQRTLSEKRKQRAEGRKQENKFRVPDSEILEDFIPIYFQEENVFIGASYQFLIYLHVLRGYYKNFHVCRFTFDF